jgi:tetratricopeptide (TPR) repeat protein
MKNEDETHAQNTDRTCHCSRNFGPDTEDETPAYLENYQQGVRAVNAKEYRKAISLLLSVIEEKPRSPDALNYLGYSYRKTGDYARAVTYYKKALSLDPDHRGANEYLGQAYIELGNLKAAQARLDALESICGIDCDEYNTLKVALDAAMARNAKQG